MESEITISLEDALSGGKKNIRLSGRSLEVNIPEGVREGAKLRLAGQGEPSAGGAGDLFLKVKFLAHPTLGVDGADITYDLFLAPWEAVLGTTARIPTLEGEIEMNIPESTSSGRRFRLAARGDQMVKVRIKSPENLTDEQRELWQKLAELSKQDVE